VDMGSAAAGPLAGAIGTAAVKHARAQWKTQRRSRGHARSEFILIRR
jgi:hypothetical protein